MAALFNIAEAYSAEAAALFELADRLSECPQFIELAEAVDTAAARKLAVIGPVVEPLDGEQFTRSELEQKFFFCRLAPQDDEGHSTADGETGTECPLEGGQIEVYLRRQVREIEVDSVQGRQDVYLYFLDRVAAIAHQVKEKANANGCPRLGTVAREFGPSFCDFATEAGQGLYIWASFNVEWGDLDLGAQ